MSVTTVLSDIFVAQSSLLVRTQVSNKANLLSGCCGRTDYVDWPQVRTRNWRSALPLPTSSSMAPLLVNRILAFAPSSDAIKAILSHHSRVRAVFSTVKPEKSASWERECFTSQAQSRLSSFTRLYSRAHTEFERSLRGFASGAVIQSSTLHKGERVCPALASASSAHRPVKSVLLEQSNAMRRTTSRRTSSDG